MIRTRKSSLAAQGTLDLELRHRPPVAIDLARFDLWASRILVHAAAGDRAGVRGGAAVLEWIRERIAHVLGEAGARELDADLRNLRHAADGGHVRAAGDHAARLAALVRGLTPRLSEISASDPRLTSQGEKLTKEEARR